MEEQLAKLKKNAACQIVKLYDYECVAQTASEDTKIFASKYEIRAILLNLLGMVKQLDAKLDHPQSMLLWCFLNLKLATNFIETEEKPEGRQKLEETLKTLKTKPMLSELLKFLDFFSLPNNLRSTSKPQLDPLAKVLDTFAGLLQFCFNSLAVISAPSLKEIDCASNVEDDPGDDIQPELSENSALYWLLRARSVFKLYKLVFSEFPRRAPECWESIAFLGECTDDQADVDFVKEMMFQTGYTTTIFMLAQAYSNDGDHANGSKYCQKTLCRQLRFAPRVEDLLKRFGVYNTKASVRGDSVAVPPCDWLATAVTPVDSLDWASNAFTLSEFYTTSRCYESALECLTSAATVLNDPHLRSCLRFKSSDENDLLPELSSPPPPKNPSGTPQPKSRVLQVRADLARCCIEYALCLLEAGKKQLAGEEGTEPAIKTPPSYGTLFSLFTSDALFDAYGSSPKTLSVDRATDSQQEAVNTLSTPPQEFPAAACLFRWICRQLAIASSFYTMDEYCSDAADLLLAHARAYDLITAFETDVSRKCCMQKRRAEILEPLLNQLNPQHYMAVCRQIMFELADAFSSLSELTAVKLKASTKLPEEVTRIAKKANSFALHAIEVYHKFLDSFQIPVDNSRPDFYNDSYLRSVLLAHFYCARLHSRKLNTNPKTRISNLSAALLDYQSMVKIADKHITVKPYLSKMIGEEVGIARDMLQLLPLQIARITSGDLAVA